VYFIESAEVNFALGAQMRETGEKGGRCMLSVAGFRKNGTTVTNPPCGTEFLEKSYSVPTQKHWKRCRNYGEYKEGAIECG